MKFKKVAIKQKPSKTILLGMVSLAFVIAGSFMIAEEPLKGWSITLFFGLCLIVFIVQLIPNSTQLILTEEGFEMTTLFRKSIIKWTDVESFNVGYVGRNKTIRFDFVSTHDQHKPWKSIAKVLSGNHGALPTTYGVNANELLAVLNEWKDKYGVTQNEQEQNPNSTLSE